MNLALRTDTSETIMVGLDTGGSELFTHTWESGRKLAEELLGSITAQLKTHGHTLDDITGLITFQGPGSFTGLRIGLATTNALAYSLGVPNVGAVGDSWIQEGFKRLRLQTGPQIVVPVYDRGPNVTFPKK